MTVRNATYKVKTDDGYDILNFSTVASQVSMADGNVNVQQMLTEEIYYDEITIQKFRSGEARGGKLTDKLTDASTEGTTYWITTIPPEDKDGNPIVLRKGVSEKFEGLTDHNKTSFKDSNGFELPSDFAFRKGATLVINASVAGEQGVNANSIIDGVIKADLQTYSKVSSYLGIKKDGTLFKVEGTKTAKECLDAGAYQLFYAFDVIVEGGKATPRNEKIANWTVKHPRTVIGQKADKTVIILTCEGRERWEAGFTLDECAKIMIDQGCTFAYNLDGGGSSALIHRGQRINDRIDSGRKQERLVYDFIYVSKVAQRDYKMDMTREVLQNYKDMGDLRSYIQDVVVDMFNLKDIEGGVLRMRGAEKFEYAGFEVWQGNAQKTKFALTPTEMKYHDYTQPSNPIMEIDKEGDFTTRKGTVGMFMNITKNVDDLNTINESGLYWCLETAKGVPTKGTSWGIIHFQPGSESQMQIAFPYHTDMKTYKLKMRRTGVEGNQQYTEWMDL